MSERGFLVVSELVLGAGAPASDDVVCDAFVAYVAAIDAAELEFKRAVLGSGRWAYDSNLDFRPIDNADSRRVFDRAKLLIAQAALKREVAADEKMTLRDDVDRPGPGVKSPFRRAP